MQAALEGPHDAVVAKVENRTHGGHVVEAMKYLLVASPVVGNEGVSNLGGDDQRIAIAVGQFSPQPNLAFSESIDGSGVEIIDAEIECLADGGSRLILRDVFVQPAQGYAPESEAGNPEIGAADPHFRDCIHGIRLPQQ